MIINFEQTLKQIDGKELVLEGGQPGTLKHFAVEALQLTFQDEQSLSGEDKAKRYILATRIYANPEIDLKVEELALIKKLIGKAYGPLIVGQAYQVIEG